MEVVNLLIETVQDLNPELRKNVNDALMNGGYRYPERTLSELQATVNDGLVTVEV